MVALVDVTENENMKIKREDSIENLVRDLDHLRKGDLEEVMYAICVWPKFLLSKQGASSGHNSLGLVRSDEGISGCVLGCLKQDHAKADEAMDFGDNLSDEENDLGYGVPAGSLRARTANTICAKILPAQQLIIVFEWKQEGQMTEKTKILTRKTSLVSGFSYCMQTTICTHLFYYYFPWYIFVPYDLHIAMPQTLQRNCTIPSRSSSATTL